MLHFFTNQSTTSSHLIYTYRFDSQVSQSPDARHRTPVKLDTAADMIRATPEHHDTFVVKQQVIFIAIVRHVQIVRLGWILGRHCVDLLNKYKQTLSH